MAPIRRSNRVPKPRDYWDPAISYPRQRQPPPFTIYTDPTEDLNQLRDALSAQLYAGLTEGLIEGLTEGLTEGLMEDSSTKPDNNEALIEPDNDEALTESDNDEALTESDDDEALTESDNDEALTESDNNEALTESNNEASITEPDQPRFLPKDRPGMAQNLPENPDPVKLFQLFFTIKEIENIVKQTNQRAAFIDFKHPWVPLTVTEAYRYLGCLIYMGVQPLRELSDHWQLKTPVASCLTRRRFYQIRRAFTIRDPYTDPQQPKDPWWFRVEPLATTIREACQKYWIPGARLAVDECMVPYFGRIRHAIKAPHKPVKQGYKIWALGDHGYIFNWLFYSKTRGTEGLRRRSWHKDMADTQALVIALAKSLPEPVQGYTLYLDNLFTNVSLMNALGELGIGAMGTTRVNASGLPLEIIQLKKAKESLEWGHLKVVAIDGVICFLWQDNNRVLGKILT